MLFKREQNTLKCYGSIFRGDGIGFMSYFEEMQKRYNEITIRLHTYGGSVFDGNLMFNAINQSTAEVTIIIEGLAASMGAVLLMATDRVKISENAYIMIHAPSGGAHGTASELKNIVTLLEAMQANFIKKLMQRTGKAQKDVQKLMVGDNWFDAKQAKEMGLVTEIIEAKNKPVVPIQSPQNIGEIEVFNAYATLLSDTHQSETNFNRDIEMKQLLITALALSAVTAESSDTAVIEAIKDKVKKLETDKNQAEQATADLKQQLDGLKKEQIKAVIDAHAKENDIADDKRNILQKIGETSGMEALMAVLDAPKPKSENQAPNIKGLIQNGKGTDSRANWDWDKWQEEDPRGLEALAVSDKDTYNDLYNKKYKK